MEFGTGGTVVPFTVVDARPPRTFSFRWTHPSDEVAAVPYVATLKVRR